MGLDIGMADSMTPVIVAIIHRCPHPSKTSAQTAAATCFLVNRLATAQQRGGASRQELKSMSRSTPTTTLDLEREEL